MQKALELAEEMQDKELLFEAYSAIGLSYIRDKLFDKAIVYYQKAIVLANQANNKNQLTKKQRSLSAVNETILCLRRKRDW
jgi:tetratricopeptide (TPR) repeat protein